MKHALTALIIAASLTTTSAAQPSADDEGGVNDAPLTEGWSPSEWGADDKIGAANRMNPETVLKAIQLVKRGKVATLGKIYSSDMPVYGTRGWSFRIENFPPARAWGPLRGANLDDHLEASIGQVGTQFDGPGHIGVLTSQGYVFYNGRRLTDPGISKDGLGPLGVEHVAQKGFVCRGVLLDAVALRGGALPVPSKPGIDDPGVISPADIDEMVRRQKIAPIREGDCVFLHTGHGNLWDPKNWDSFSPEEKARRTKEFNAGEPGFGLSACRHLAERKVALTGADTWSVESFTRTSQGEGGALIECHIELQNKNGIWNLENLDLTQLVEDKAYEFLFVWSPLKIRGGTGSPGNPVAIY
jgi:kynurenine formamidase